MHLLLLLAGVAMAGAGAAMVRFALPVEDAAGTALFISGVGLMVGAALMSGFAAAIYKLGRIASRLDLQPLAPPMAVVERDGPAPRPVRSAPAAPTPAVAAPAVAKSTAASEVAARSRAEPAPASETLPAMPSAAQPSAANTVYRSGVIDGMAYTLFMDGSIQAELAQGTVRFASIDELQKYLANKS